MKHNIVLIYRSGGDFKIADAYLLTAHIHKYWADEKSEPHIYCFSDTTDKEINVIGLTILPLPNPEWKGWWSKMNLFADELKQFRPFLYLDLDTIVLKSLKDLFPPEKEQWRFVTLRDFYRPNHLASGVMWIPDGVRMNTIYSEWLKNKKKFRGDQNFIESVVKEPDSYWQDISKPEFITTFKPLVQKRAVWRTEFPANSAVVCFHGKPRIPVAAKTVKWVKSYTNYEI